MKEEREELKNSLFWIFELWNMDDHLHLLKFHPEVFLMEDFCIRFWALTSSFRDQIFLGIINKKEISYTRIMYTKDSLKNCKQNEKGLNEIYDGMTFTKTQDTRPFE